jgi:hypothetical protein
MLMQDQKAKASEFMAERPLLCSKSVRPEKRRQYVKIFVWAVALYQSEAWTIGKNGSEKNRSLRDLVLEEDAENQMDGKGKKRGGIQKNRRKKDSMERHTQKKNNVG